MAEHLAIVFRAHDNSNKEKAIEALQEIDKRQFPELSDDAVKLASEAFVNSLWEKDRIEFDHLKNGTIDRAGLRGADYSPAIQQLRQRATIIGADQRYAITKAEAWKQHKIGGDYWSPFQRSQVYELRAALDDPEYPDKPRAGQAGPGPEAMRYALAFELHDMHTERHWLQGVRVMTPYFTKILAHHEDGGD
ncbi:hypothetical protein ACFQL1_20015 [Halomicroarcula sp. GCM10025709]|uniref:hypothetical protein n=1 Tax=Haloarcula TaxID=2237 RepID=UPI0024C24127|nr:hypothetical protein [Halomicroarcula sp. YJ-61-S]